MIEYRFEPENKRAAAYMDGDFVGEATISVSPSLWVIDHTGVETRARGMQVGAGLIALLVKAALEAEVKIMPLCPFAKKEFDKHPEYAAALHGA